MKFSSEDLLEIVSGGSVADLTLISDEIWDKSRWSIIHRIIFQHGNRYFSTTYSVGATESQDESPFEYADDEVECEEVIPVEKTVIVYEPKKENE